MESHIVCLNASSVLPEITTVYSSIGSTKRLREKDSDSFRGRRDRSITVLVPGLEVEIAYHLCARRQDRTAVEFSNTLVLYAAEIGNPI